MFKIAARQESKPLETSLQEFSRHMEEITYQWLKILTVMTFTLVPLFFILDYFTMPGNLLARFGIYRLSSSLIVISQFIVLRQGNANKYTYLHGYLISLNVGGMVAMMTVDLGGFNSSYYAGLNLVIIGVNLLLPWRTIHSIFNCIIVLSMYIIFNLIAAGTYDVMALINHLFFLTATAVVVVSITHVRYKMVRQEFDLREELEAARDALWSEMELAKRIQTALLPEKRNIKGFNIAALMSPAKEVGGDYYDIIEHSEDDKWAAIGDVSGHGVDSGLIMMMAQTSILSVIRNNKDIKPSAVLSIVNSIIRENISRLGSDHYMSVMVIRFSGSGMTVAGKHQDIIIYRSSSNKTEVIPSTGTWLGIADNIGKYLKDSYVELNAGDIVLLFTDGITEASSNSGDMFGQERLERALHSYADLPVGKLLDNIMQDVKTFSSGQDDDITLMAIKKDFHSKMREGKKIRSEAG